MPEFEKTNSSPNPSHNYTPSKDASEKPRGRRRSGGFKAEVASSRTASMGEVNAANALKNEKLSGSAHPQENEECPKHECPEPAEVAKATDIKSEKTPVAQHEPREERITNPQPNEATLASIKSIETKIAERRDLRDTRRKEHEKNRPPKSTRPERSNRPQSQSKGESPSAKKSGLLVTITQFFGKLFNSEPKQTPANTRGGQNRQISNHTGTRSEQTRQSGNRQSGNRQGSNRNGKGRRQGGEKRHTAKSLSTKS